MIAKKEMSADNKEKKAQVLATRLMVVSGGGGFGN